MMIWASRKESSQAPTLKRSFKIMSLKTNGSLNEGLRARRFGVGIGFGLIGGWFALSGVGGGV